MNMDFLDAPIVPFMQQLKTYTALLFDLRLNA